MVLLPCERVGVYFWCVGCTRTAPAKQLLRWQGAIKAYVYFFQLSNAGGAQDARGEMTDWLFAVGPTAGFVALAFFTHS